MAWWESRGSPVGVPRTVLWSIGVPGVPWRFGTPIHCPMAVWSPGSPMAFWDSHPLSHGSLESRESHGVLGLLCIVPLAFRVPGVAWWESH